MRRRSTRRCRRRFDLVADTACTTAKAGAATVRQYTVGLLQQWASPKESNMNTLPACPQCSSEFTYEDGGLYICPECAHEWPQQAAETAEETTKVWRDAAGNILQDGDTVSVIKDLKLKGGGGVVKIGTKVKNIRLVDGDHDIDCKIDGFGQMGLKTEFVKKV